MGNVSGILDGAKLGRVRGTAADLLGERLRRWWRRKRRKRRKSQWWITFNPTRFYWSWNQWKLLVHNGQTGRCGDGPADEMDDLSHLRHQACRRWWIRLTSSSSPRLPPEMIFRRTCPSSEEAALESFSSAAFEEPKSF
ncbi:unnamed protein product [Pleuronectes platessa]|uniref:Uncharacterized protein n=1 Tax=Pleuronectes platessa TaxID=8262 RepID=A0A9N7U7D1_PLEPL|nr:unnamed protein product [Pleuronectes platessa]